MIKIKCEACTISEGLVVKIMVISPEGRGGGGGSSPGIGCKER